MKANNQEITNLNQLQPATFDKVEIVNDLDKMDQNTRLQVLGAAIGSLKYGGNIFLVGTDLSDLVRKSYIGELSTEELSKIIYDNRSISDVTDMCRALQMSGIQIITQRVEDGTYSILGARNGQNGG